MATFSDGLLTFLLNSTWQIPLVAAVAGLACRLMRRAPASYHHAIWATALAAALLLPLASVRTDRHIVRLASWLPSSSSTAVAAGPVSPPATRTVPMERTIAATAIAFYLLLLLFGFWRLASAWTRTARIRRSGERCRTPALLADIWLKCMESFGVSEVELLVSSAVSTPVAAGVWRGEIILPERLITETSNELLTTAVGHEMSHVARHDFAWKLLRELLSVPIWYHPATWLIHRGLERTCEMACDDLVTERLQEPNVYARSLLSIAVAVTRHPSPACMPGVFGGDILEERIRRLVERRIVNRNHARLLLAVGVSAMILCAVLASGAAVAARAQRSSPDEMNPAAADLLGGLMARRLAGAPSVAPPPPPPPPDWFYSAGSSLVSTRPLSMLRPDPAFWQVAGESAMTADSLIESLKRKGFSARLLVSGDGSVRVIAGPHGDPRSFERAKADLEAAGFRATGTW